MNLKELFEMQKKLDSYIQSNQGAEGDLFEKKGLALLVELAELANETRSFKFWSNKGPSERSVILEEYVDSIHFLLSLGIEKNLDMLEEWPEAAEEKELTSLFLQTQKAILNFLESHSMSDYLDVWSFYGAIAAALDFSYEEVLQAYHEKNKKNYERQDQGY